ncbi:helix-turn-helix domain-containing protein [Candidatus Symbiopectobacterium sp. NZEC127]|nr:helix-turn-helix domain-containing protein [Candidatus Symbiopectobacterium sp. NZEC127]
MSRELQNNQSKSIAINTNLQNCKYTPGYNAMVEDSVITDETFRVNDSLFFIRPLTPESTFTFSIMNSRERVTFTGDQSAVLVSNSAIELSLHGKWLVGRSLITQLATFLAFTEYRFKESSRLWGANAAPLQHKVLFETEKIFCAVIDNAQMSFMDLVFCRDFISDTDVINKLCHFIRGIESYWVAQFLLDQVLDNSKSMKSHKLYNSCKEYGVSESYFRKLCYNAFTCGPKKQLRMWRAAYSALQLIENDESIATVAWNNGYASSSHFSTEIKTLFGITPREFKNLEGFLNE